MSARLRRLLFSEKGPIIAKPVHEVSLVPAATEMWRSKFLSVMRKLDAEPLPLIPLPSAAV
ncbi:hypothetical protein BVC93_04715 [Mycobacterium sp. MS1601]|nr:hypothetical protein BVC93_04715 [Mycobacterium sp. MS1601]